MNRNELADWVADPRNMPGPDDKCEVVTWAEATAMRLLPSLIGELDARSGVQVANAIAVGFCSGFSKALYMLEQDETG